MIGRMVRKTVKRSIHRIFRIGQRCGVDILPRHFYSSIPDIGALSRSTWWRKPLEMAGVNGVDIESQLAFVRECCTPELQARLKTMDLLAYGTKENGEPGYGVTEADFLYCFISTKRPKRIVQVGAGFSTAIILKAAADADYQVELTCIDPFPTGYLKRIDAAGKIKLIPEMAQTVDRGVLTDIGPGNLLFIDSTHTVKAGSEVNRLILDILPRLATGSYVHVHDIYFPYDYQRSLLWEPFFNGESTLLHAFLACNSRYTIRCALSMLHYAKTKELQSVIPNYRPQDNKDGLREFGSEGNFPSACYMQVIT
jgi:hypothetical protein